MEDFQDEINKSQELRKSQIYNSFEKAKVIGQTKIVNGKTLVWSVTPGGHDWRIKKETAHVAPTPKKVEAEKEVKTEDKKEEVEAQAPEKPTHPVTMMMLEDYKKEVTPLIKEYRKFKDKNKQYFAFVGGYGGSGFPMSYDEVVEGIKNKTMPLNHYGNYDRQFMNVQGSGKYQVTLTDDQLIEQTYKTGWNRSHGDENKYELIKDVPDNVMKEKNILVGKLKKYFTSGELAHLTSDQLNSNKRFVRDAIDNDIYKRQLSSGEINIEDLEKVGESVGVKIPKKVFDETTQMAMANAVALAKLKASFPKINKDVLLGLVDSISADIKPLEVQIIDKETRRYDAYIKDIMKKGEVGEGELQSNLPIWAVVFEFEKSEQRKVGTHQDWKGRDVDDFKYFLMNPKLKGNFQPHIDRFVKTQTEELKNNMLAAVSKNFYNISEPIKEIKKNELKIGKTYNFEGTYDVTMDNGTSFVFKTEGIGAGGYNIQKFHFRYISNTTDVKTADGKKGEWSYDSASHTYTIKPSK